MDERVTGGSRNGWIIEWKMDGWIKEYHRFSLAGLAVYLSLDSQNDLPSDKSPIP